MQATTPVEFGTKYDLLCKIASGGMAEIFLARARGIEGFEKYIVIKKILQNRTQDPDFVRMFLDEARLAATLDHPNVVHIYDVGSIDDEYFIAMEHLQGHDLTAVVRAEHKRGKARPPIEHTISILANVCAGLHYAHEKRDFQGRPLEIVHRDVTPQNILITFEGVVKLVDFGIAKCASREVETMAGTLKGKIGYMAPEQCTGMNIDRRADIFAVGVLLYELTTGKRCYRERSDFDAIKRIIEGPVPSPRDVIAEFPADLERIIVKCLQKKPDDRYQTARELQAELEAFAREHQLVTGSVALEQYMEELFADEVSSMRANPANMQATVSAMPSRSTYAGEARSKSNPLMDATRARRRIRGLQVACVVASALVVFLVWKRWTPEQIAPPPRPATESAAALPGAARVAGALPGGVGPAAGNAVTNTTAPAAAAAPAPSASAPAPSPSRTRIAAPRSLAEAHVTVASEPRCEVLIDGSPYGSTPLVDAAIAPGRHALTLLNSTAGIREVEHVWLSSGQLWTRAFTFENGHVLARSEVPPRMLARGEAPARPVEPAVHEPVHREPPAVKPHVVEGPVAAPAVVHALPPAPAHMAAAPAHAPVAARESEPAASAPAPAVAPPAQPDRLEPAKWRTESFDRSPPYPDAAMKSGVEGQVVLRICIGPTGSVDTATVLKPLGFGCDEAAVSWAKKRWHFDPAKRGGKPVSSCIIQPVSFKRSD